MELQVCTIMNWKRDEEWALKVYGILVLFLIISSSNTEAAITLSPSGVARVCPGGMLVLTCSTNADLMQWSVRVPLYDATETRLLQYSGTAQRTTPIVIGSVTFNISRMLDESLTLPLVSTIVSNGVTTDINGTVVICTEVGTNTQLLTSIHIIGHESLPRSPVIKKREEFGLENVIVMLDWNPEMGMSYDVIVNPSVPVKVVESASAQLVVSYNSMYNASVVATLCGHTNTTVSTQLSYARCSYPLNEDESRNITGYSASIPALEGTIIMFSCAYGLELIGSAITTCMGNGEWEPDPRDVECKANCGPLSSIPNSQILPYASTVEGAMATITCQNVTTEDDYIVAVCNREGKWEMNATADVCTNNVVNVSNTSTCSSTTIPNNNLIVIAIGSSIAAVLASSALLILLGFCLGYCVGKRGTKQQSIPVSSRNNRVELMENVAYATVN